MSSQSLTVSIVEDGDSLGLQPLKNVHSDPNRDLRADERSREDAAISLNRKASPVYDYLVGLGKNSRKSQISALKSILAATELGKQLRSCTSDERARMYELLWVFPWNQVGRKRFKGFIVAQRELAYASATINRNMCAVRRVMDLCTEPDYQGTLWEMSRSDFANATKSRGLPRVKMNRGGVTGRAFSPGELKDIFAACEIRKDWVFDKHTAIESPEFPATMARDKAVFALLFLRGMRVSEVTNLIISAYNPRTGQIRIGNSKTEAGIRNIPADAAKIYLDAWIEMRNATGGRPEHKTSGPIFLEVSRLGKVVINKQRTLSNNAIRAILRKRCTLAKLAMATTHDGRRTAVTWQYENGGLVAAQELAGHKSPEQTLKYLRYSKKHHEEAHRALFTAQAEALGLEGPEDPEESPEA